MNDTPNLALPYLAASQAQKHVTVNEALLLLDVLVQARVVSIGETTPPVSPSDGDVYIPGSGATGAWDDWDWNIAYVADGDWRKAVPKAGWTVYNADDDMAYRYDPVTFWQPVGEDVMAFKGVVDCSTNPNYPAADRGHTYRVSVAGKIGGGSGVDVEAGDLLICLMDGTAAGDQATVGANWSIAQANLDGAVIGPASATDGAPVLFDGVTGKLIKETSFASFKTALELVKADVGLGSVLNVPQREQLTAARTYYVRTDGSDSNDGLADSAGGAFLTLQKAMDTIAALDISTFTVTVNVRAGTYAGGLVLKTVVGAGTVQFIGDETTPSNVHLNVTGANAVSSGTAMGTFIIAGFKLASSNTQDVRVASRCRVTLRNNDYAGTANYRVYCQAFGYLSVTGANHRISGGGIGFFLIENFGYIEDFGATYTFTGDVTYTSAFATSRSLGSMVCLATFALNGFTVTGPRYSVTQNAILQTGGGGASFFPGSSGGSTATGGQYS